MRRCIHISNGGSIYRFGRVVRTDAKLLPIRDCILIYIYSVGASSKLPVPLLSKDALLVPPILTSRAPWLMGYFETLENEPLAAEMCWRYIASIVQFTSATSTKTTNA